jgi:endonuclease/exonuclease/phosphatase (EEP) superfamily protein YafD
MTSTQSTESRLPPALRLYGRVARNLLQALVGSYALSLSAFLILRALAGESVTLIAILNSYVHLLLILSPLALIPALILRSRLLLLLLALPLWVFLTSYSGQFLPRPTVQASAATPTEFRLLTYNLLRSNLNTEGIIAVIRGADADVVALQEVTPLHAAALTAALGDLYPHQALHPQDDFSGQGVLSRYPILTDEFWQIHLGHQRVELELAGGLIALYNTHPIHPFIGGYPDFYRPETRAAEIEALLTRAAAETLPVLLAGDFNLSDQETAYQQITAQYADAYRQVGWGMGFTFPAFSLPLARIDYVFHSPAFTPLEAQVEASGAGSDHLPVWVKFTVLSSQSQ